MAKWIFQIWACLTATALLLVGAYLVRPIAEMSPIRQVKGTEFTRPYLGRALEVIGGEVSQTFTAPKGGLLNGIGIYTPIPNRQSSGAVRFVLYKLTDNRRSEVFDETSDISRLANNEGLSIFRFKPIDISKGDRFIMRLVSTAKPAFFVFFNSRGDAYKGGTAFLGPRRLQADLAFQVFYKLDPAEYWRHLSKRTPNLLGPTALLAALCLTWFAAAALFWGLWQVKGSQAPRAKD